MPRKVLEQGIALALVAEKARGIIYQNTNKDVRGICPFEQPAEHELTFTRETNARRLKRALESTSVNLAAVLVPNSLDPSALPSRFNYILCEDPLSSLLNLVPLFFEAEQSPPGVSPKADIHPTCRLGAHISVGAFTSIAANVQIGDHAIIHPHVTLYPNVIVGEGCIIHAGAVLREGSILGAGCVVQPGAVIGADGFGYIPDPKLGLKAVPQIGYVTIDDQVDIGANACVDRATFGVTRIGRGSKLDNLVQVGHNVQIGRFTIVCGQTGIAGSCQIGNNVVLGGGVGVGDHIKIADNIRVGGKSGVTGDLITAGDYGGFPALEAKKWRRQVAALARLARVKSCNEADESTNDKNERETNERRTDGKE